MHAGTAYTPKELKKRIKIPELEKKLKKMAKFRVIGIKPAITDYDTQSNVRTNYYYVGVPHIWIPEPRVIL